MGMSYDNMEYSDKPDMVKKDNITVPRSHVQVMTELKREHKQSGHILLCKQCAKKNIVYTM